MKILLLGATGRAGRMVLGEAIKSGLEVNCLARNSDRIEKHPGIKIFGGSPNNGADLQQAMAGCEGIISVLNISRNSDFPWSGLRTPEKYLSEVMGILIPIAENEKVKRLVVCSAWGVAETYKDVPSWFQWFIDHSNIGVAYKDHERQEAIIEKSRLEWTIVRPAGLTNSGKSQRVRESFGNEPKPSMTISRKSLANYMVECLRNDRLIRKKVVISKD